LTQCLPSMGYIEYFPPSIWICRIFVGIIGCVISGRFLRTELQKRRLNPDLVKSAHLRYTSIACLWCGPIGCILLILSVIPGFCILRLTGNLMLLVTQYLTLGFYQLSRLEYCFSKDSLHGRKEGYPLWVFVIMNAVGVMIWISALIMVLFVDTLPRKCGYSSGFTFFVQFRDKSLLFEGDYYSDDYMKNLYYAWYFCSSVAVQMWDVMTLLLYYFKIRQIAKIHKSKEDGVWRRVLRIMHRIVIVTMFYLYFNVLTLLTFIGLSVASFPVSWQPIVDLIRVEGMTTLFNVTISFVMFLMMDHNLPSYRRYLESLRKSYLHYFCFCCYNGMVEEQLANIPIIQPQRSVSHRSFPRLPRMGRVRSASPTPKPAPDPSEEIKKADPSSETNTVYPNISKGNQYKTPSAEPSTRTETSQPANMNPLDIKSRHLDVSTT